MHDAAARGRCAVLTPGEQLKTQVSVEILPAHD
jgi:hypothetical protein